MWLQSKNRDNGQCPTGHNPIRYNSIIGSYNVNKLQWHKASVADLQKFKYTIESKLQVLNTPDAVYCTDFNCNNKSHKVQ